MHACMWRNKQSSEQMLQAQGECGATQSREIRAGQTLTDARGDKYQVIKKLGEGGMGAVFQLLDLRLGIMRAVKFMHDDVRRQGGIKRFQREIKVLANLNNPFIVPAQDVIEVNTGGKRQLGLVMNMVEGSNLSLEIINSRKIAPKRVALLAGQLAFALESLRKEGLIHRDLKPENILLHTNVSGETFVQIGDFGVVGFAFQDERQAHTTTVLKNERSKKFTGKGTVIGTPRYMSPEEIENKSVDHRSDLYALGVVIYEMLEGHTPFRGPDTHIFYEHLEKKVPSLTQKTEGEIPSWLEQIVLTLLEKKPKDRIQTAAEVFEAIKDGVRKDFPELLNEIPFIYDLEFSPSAYASQTRLAA